MKTLPGAFVALAGRVITCDASAEGPLGAIDGGALVVEKGKVVFVGEREEAIRKAKGAPIAIDAPGSLLTPGLVDAHTHAAWMGSRHHEYAQRMAGAGYEEIAKAGGGILSSREAIQRASREEIAETLIERLRRMASLGVTSVEVKSGYGLDIDNERKQLEAISIATKRDDLPRIVPTFLALHALPPEWAPRREAYVDEAVRAVGEFAKEGLMSFVDAYVDRNAFTVDEARRIGLAALDANIGVRLHIGQFADIGGAKLAAELGAKSVDHLEHVDEAGLSALAEAGTRAVLLPAASMTLRQAPPPIEKIRKAGVKMVVASDANPGTAPTESLPLAMALAVCAYGLSPDEVLLGATREAAYSLGLEGRAGTLKAGSEADFVVWDLPHEHALVQPWGLSRARHVVSRGRILSET